MGLVLLLPPVAEVPVFPSDSLPPLPSPPSSRHSAPSSPVHVLSLIWMGMSRATSNTCFLPPCPPPLSRSPSHHHHLSPLSLSACFPLSSPSCSVLCDLLKPGRHVITLLDTKNSRQPVFLEEEEEKEQGKQSDTTSRLSGHSVRPENMYVLPGDTDYASKTESHIKY